MAISWIVAGGVVLLLWRWFYVWNANRQDNAAFEYRIRNRQDLK
jgi:hypothetical protein